MQPPQQQPGPYPGYGYGPQQPPMSMQMPMILGKRVLFLIIGLGALLSWIALVVRATVTLDSGGLKAISVLFLLGTLFGFGGSLMGALGSPKTDAQQNHGLLQLAGFWLLVQILGFLFIRGLISP